MHISRRVLSLAVKTVWSCWHPTVTCLGLIPGSIWLLTQLPTKAGQGGTRWCARSLGSYHPHGSPGVHSWLPMATSALPWLLRESKPANEKALRILSLPLMQQKLKFMKLQCIDKLVGWVLWHSKWSSHLEWSHPILECLVQTFAIPSFQHSTLLVNLGSSRCFLEPLGSCSPCERCGWSTWLLTSAWSIPDLDPSTLTISLCHFFT